MIRKVLDVGVSIYLFALIMCIILAFSGVLKANDPLPPPCKEQLPPPVATYNPYGTTDENEFKRYIKHAWHPGVVVGDVKNPFYNTYRPHYIAKSGYRNLKDGAYLASGNWENIKFQPHDIDFLPEAKVRVPYTDLPTAPEGWQWEYLQEKWWLVKIENTVVREVPHVPFVQSVPNNELCGACGTKCQCLSGGYKCGDPNCPSSQGNKPKPVTFNRVTIPIPVTTVVGQSRPYQVPVPVARIGTTAPVVTPGITNRRPGCATGG